MQPFQKCILEIESELKNLEKNEIFRIKVDLKENRNFYLRMKELDVT